VDAFRAAVVAGLGSTTWRIEVVPVAASTNTALLARVRAGECAEPTALIALDQTGGKGRLERRWVTPPGTALALSLTVPLPADPAGWGVVPLAAGVAVVRAVAGFGVAARLKWPNDVIQGERKLSGILVEVHDRTAVVGIGVNVTQGTDTVFPGGVSLAMLGADASRTAVAAAVIAQVDAVMEQLPTPAGRADLLSAYRETCDTLGRTVRVFCSETDWVDGTAVDVTDGGELCVRTSAGLRTYASGDVMHLR